VFHEPCFRDQRAGEHRAHERYDYLPSLHILGQCLLPLGVLMTNSSNPRVLIVQISPYITPVILQSEVLLRGEIEYFPFVVQIFYPEIVGNTRGVWILVYREISREYQMRGTQRRVYPQKF
jgi:hypothetical protein